MRFSRLRGLSRLEAVAVLAYPAIQAVWYPVAIAINDETAYLGLTYVLRARTIFAEQANISLVLPCIHNGHQSLLYPLGEITGRQLPRATRCLLPLDCASFPCTWAPT